MLPLIPIIEIGSRILDKFFPDPEKKAAAQLELFKLQQAGAFKEIELAHAEAIARADIIKTEASSEHWLTSTWRPITMLTFTALIVARWFGWAAPDLTPEEYLALWDIVKIGLGGYVVGRSAEKVVPGIIAALKK